MASSRLLKAFTLGFALTISSNVFAASAQQLLTEDLQLAIKALPRETRLYHYFGINLGGQQLQNTSLKKAKNRYQLVQDRLKNAAASFWNVYDHTTQLANAGIGLYLAIDPYSSSPAAAPDTGANFGSTMMEVTFNAGTKYLSLINDVALRDETIQAIIAETGMKPADAGKLLLSRVEPSGKKSHKGFARDTLQYMAEAQNTKFRKLVYSIFEQQGIAMTEYGWQAGTSALCSTDGVRQMYSALVYVGGKNTAGAVKSVTMVYWNYANGVEFDAQEIEAKNRNAKLFGLLYPLRSLEKQFKAAAEAGDKASRKSTWSGISNLINSTYTDVNELAEIRAKTFKCVK